MEPTSISRTSRTASIDNSHSRQDFLNKGIFTLSDFTAPTMGTNGSEKRNLFRNPGYLNLDSSMIKNNKLPFWGRESQSADQV